MNYLLPQLEVTGKRTVWSVETLAFSSTVLTKTWRDWTGVSCWLDSTIGDGLIEGSVDQMF